MMPLSNQQVIHNGRYRIVSLLGQGGMGAVYQAWDLSLDIPVAIKENLDGSPEAQKQFGREANMLARLSHPNLPRVTDYFFIPGQGQYLVMDFVEGEDLHEMLNRLGALPEPQVLNWISQICDALAYLHSQPSPIIHRDIKPANIKIRPDGRAVLVDFGIAKVYDPHLATTIGAKAVTPGYSPPEQYGSSGSTDARSDIYALGATLYHLLTGSLPPESLDRIVGSSTLCPPRQLNQNISPTAEGAILKAIEVATDRRFQTVDELRAALAQPVPGAVPQTPIPPTVVVPAQPFAPVAPAEKRPTSRRSCLWLSVSLLVIGIIGIIVTFCLMANGLFTLGTSARSTPVTPRVTASKTAARTAKPSPVVGFASPPPAPGWVVRKDYTANGPLVESNQTNGWTITRLDRDLSLDGPFRLQVHFLELYGSASGILLFGQEATGSEWWSGMQRLEFGLDNQGRSVFVNLYDGTKSTPVITPHFPLPQDRVVNVEIGSQGVNAVFLDSHGSLLAAIDIVASSKALPKGLFPHGIRVFALSTAAASGLTIDNLQLLEPGK
jgi:serine/threonine protein kinase